MLHNCTPPAILVVDDAPENIAFTGAALRDHYHIKVATDGNRALELANTPPTPSLILLDINMPGMTGYDVCRQLKASPTTRRVPVIFLTAKDEVADEAMGLSLGAADYLAKPVNPAILRARVKAHLALFDQRMMLEEQVRERTRELEESHLHLIECLSRAAGHRDNETGQHVLRMSHYAQHLALAAGMDAAQAQILLHAAPMHDIGKVAIPDSILQKPGKLDADEWVIMQRHAELGATILGDSHSPMLQVARTVALTHHEKWDGSGYPNGLAGENIPFVGRVTAIADVFDALTSERPYKRAWHIDDALALLQEQAGKHFDPQLISLFVAELPAILAIRERFADQPEP